MPTRRVPGARDADDAVAARPLSWLHSSCADDDDASGSCEPSDDDGPCELPLHGRPNRLSTQSPDADDACGGSPRELDDDADEFAWLPPSRDADDDAERPWPPSSDDDAAELQLLHEPCADGGAWGLRTSCVACVG